MTLGNTITKLFGGLPKYKSVGTIFNSDGSFTLSASNEHKSVEYNSNSSYTDELKSLLSISEDNNRVAPLVTINNYGNVLKILYDTNNDITFVTLQAHYGPKTVILQCGNELGSSRDSINKHDIGVLINQYQNMFKEESLQLNVKKYHSISHKLEVARNKF